MHFKLKKSVTRKCNNYQLIYSECPWVMFQFIHCPRCLEITLRSLELTLQSKSFEDDFLSGMQWNFDIFDTVYYDGMTGNSQANSTFVGHTKVHLHALSFVSGAQEH